MTGTADRWTQNPLEMGGWASGSGVGTRETYELTNAVEWVDHEEGSICYIYPADASDSELKIRWLAVPAELLVDLDATR